MNTSPSITIIGAGLAGCEAALQAANRGCRVVLHEMKPVRFSPAHTMEGLAELVCSNSLRSDNITNGSGLLKAELRLCNSQVLVAADTHKVPAGGALAVDRHAFSAAITKAIEDHPLIELKREEVTSIPTEGIVIIATGPLTSDALAEDVSKLVGGDLLYFHDAIAPIVEADSIDMNAAWRASRYDKGTADYINCPLSKEQYYEFIDDVLAAEKVELREFESLKPFEGCMPIEVMADRGKETLSFGPMKPVGLINPHTGRLPYAVLQLRQENTEATLFNLVGFQTRMKWGEQKRIFSKIPGLEQAVFARFGSLHRNTFLQAPALLQPTLQLKSNPRIFFAGQITGVEGYVESISMGWWAGVQAACLLQSKPALTPAPATMLSGLISHLVGSELKNFQPMNSNFGLLPRPTVKAPSKKRKQLQAEEALRSCESWVVDLKS
jgi:methylenetetrahydrofolate--tRNA-(uracil-5-)-methyltransferase